MQGIYGQYGDSIISILVVSEESKEPSDTGPPIEEITAAHVNELSNLRRAHNEVEELRASHQAELKATSQGYDQRIVDLERKVDSALIFLLVCISYKIGNQCII